MNESIIWVSLSV